MGSTAMRHSILHCLLTPLAATAALACASCDRAPQGGPANSSQSAANAAAGAMAPVAAPQATPQADINASLALNPFDDSQAGDVGAQPGALPPADRPLRFVGRWATDQAHCGDRAWLFTADQLTTPAGSVCRFGRVDQVPAGYDIAARCTAEGPERADTIRLRFAESAQAMLFESESVADAGLAYCGM